MNAVLRLTAHVTLVSFLAASVRPSNGWAQPQAPEPSQSSAPEAPAAASPDGEARKLVTQAWKAQSLQKAPEASAGGGSSTVSGQSAAVSGLGGGFSAQATTGLLSYGIPLGTAPSRSGQPSLSLGFSSSGSYGNAGRGWALSGGMAIQRQTDQGTPRYEDPSDNQWYPEQDRFSFGAGGALVPICTVGAARECAGKLASELMPNWSPGWQYFRAQVDGMQRFFWSPDHRTWRIQGKDGSTVELGVPLDGSEYEGGLERNPDAPTEIFRWHVTRTYDSHGDIARLDPQPLNPTIYRYVDDGNTVYLTDIYDTSPLSVPQTQEYWNYANHVRIRYEARPDTTTSYRAGFAQDSRFRVAGVDVTTRAFNAELSEPRELVRRYHLGYDPSRHVSLLLRVELEGRCAEPTDEDTSEGLPETACPRLPATTFGYGTVTGAEPIADALGRFFEPFNETVSELKDSPPHSLNDSNVGLLDVNADGLLDVLVTDPGKYNGGHGVYLNGATTDGTVATLGFEALTTMPVEGGTKADAGVLRLSNANVAPMDADGDGIVDLVHMPESKTYSVFSVKQTNAGLSWQGRTVDVLAGQDAKIDFARDARRTQLMDVNGDGLIDVVVSTATQMQTFLALGRYPGGDGRFGQAKWTGPDTAELSTEPIRSCVPYGSGQALQFGDPGVYVSEVNGDGLPDIVLMKSGLLHYWPGRGNGTWGTGSRNDCVAGEFAADNFVEMSNAPHFGSTAGGPLMLTDVNADGLSDLLEVRNDAVDIYLNDSGRAWTERHTILDTPVNPSGSSRVQLVDVNGSGTVDLLWGEAYKYRYIDLHAGQELLRLTEIRNGLGKSTELEYSTSAREMLAAAHAGEPWAKTMPLNVPVIKRMTVRDNLEAVGRPAGRYVTEYSYADPVFESRSRDFRGFQRASTINPDASAAKTTVTKEIFELGECRADLVPGLVDACEPESRWRDLGITALRGLAKVREVVTGTGTYQATTHQGYELRHLYTGLDGRTVRVVYPTQSHNIGYDTDASASFTSSGVVELDDLLLPGSTTYQRVNVVQRSTQGAVLTAESTRLDDFANVIEQKSLGCQSGCIQGTDETIVVSAGFELLNPTGDAWLWAATQDQATGSVNTGRVIRGRKVFNAQGDLLKTYGTLEGTLPLDRIHSSGGTIAPAPANASGGVSAPVEVLLSEATVNSYGQGTSAKGPNGQCVGVEFDNRYGRFPVSSKTYVGTASANGCGGTELVSQGVYDAGFGQPTNTTSPRGEVGRVDYDGFGRAVAVFGPHPVNAGTLTPLPLATIEYRTPSDPVAQPYSVVIQRALDGANFQDNQYHETYTYVDGIGRTLVQLSEADPSAGDGGDYVASGLVTHDSHGNPSKLYLPEFYPGLPLAFNLGAAPSSAYVTRDIDAFGRLTTEYDVANVPTVSYRYHAQSVDAYDAADGEPGQRQGTYATTYVDGHNRQILNIARTRDDNGTLREIRTRFEYLPSGEMVQMTRETDGQPSVTRWMRYDTFGRMVLNVEPNTSVGFTSDRNASAQSVKAYRYAYNNSGALVGTSDARGCGANYFYDAAGRSLGADISPCQSHHAPYSPADLAAGTGLESAQRYDTYPSYASSIADASGVLLAPSAATAVGRPTVSEQQGSRSVVKYDAAGRATAVASQIVKPGQDYAPAATRYANRWYVKRTVADAAGRVVDETTGNPLAALNGADGTSRTMATFAKSGALKSLTSSYGSLIASQARTADGRLTSVTYGDAAATRSSFDYDARLRLAHSMTYRASAPLWTQGTASYTPGAPDETTQLLLADTDYEYDVVGNPTHIRDQRNADDWPAGAKPVSRHFQSDPLYRVRQVDYDYEFGSDAWVSPFAAEHGDAERVQPAPHVGFTTRTRQQKYTYDWRGNILTSDDHLRGFYDRSLGTQSHGTTTNGPDQLRGASNRSGNPAQDANAGDLTTAYDATGNLTDLVVKRDGPCLPTTASCWQRYRYQWDEVGRLSSAKRWDLSNVGGANSERALLGSVTAALPTRAADAALSYAYSGTSRTLKTAVAPNGQARHTAYIFGSLELRNAVFDPATDYLLSVETVQLSIGGIGRLAYFEDNLEAISVAGPRLILHLADEMGSASIAIDHATGELIQRTTYLAYGAVNGDYRAERWGSYRSPYEFTGKESDIELGLKYFGVRYYATHLNRWMSPDPAAIHQMRADMNPYAYVSGQVASAIDPDGQEAISLGAAALIVVGAAVLGYGTSVVTQAAHKNWRFDRVEYGWGGGRGALASGAGAGIAAVVSLVAPQLGLAALGKVGGAIATGALSGAVSAGASAAWQRNASWEKIGAAAGLGALSGAVSSGVGAGLGEALKNTAGGAYIASAGGTVASSGVGLAASALSGDSVDAEDLAVDLGVGLGSSVASASLGRKVNQGERARQGAPVNQSFGWKPSSTFQPRRLTAVYDEAGIPIGELILLNYETAPMGARLHIGFRAWASQETVNWGQTIDATEVSHSGSVNDVHLHGDPFVGGFYFSTDAELQRFQNRAYNGVVYDLLFVDKPSRETFAPGTSWQAELSLVRLNEVGGLDMRYTTIKWGFVLTAKGGSQILPIRVVGAPGTSLADKFPSSAHTKDLGIMRIIR